MSSTLDSFAGAIVKNRLKVLRAESDWSQADLAKRLGVSRQTINAIETSRYDPSLSLAFRIAALFGIYIEDIFEPAPNSKRSPLRKKISRQAR